MKLSLYLSFSFVILILITSSCSNDVQSKPNYLFKSANSDGVAAKVAGVEISNDELMKGIESEVYQQEQKIFELKMNRLRAIVVEKLLEADPKSKNMTKDEYFSKYIMKNNKVSEKDINAFIAKRKIPKEHVNKQTKERIKAFLVNEKRTESVENWLGQKTKKSPIEVYLQKPRRPVFDVQVGDSPFMGGKDAKVTVVEFSDFQCPYCAKGSKVVEQLKSKYGNKIKVVFKHYPLPFHTHAKIAAAASMCAHEQGKFWKMHDVMFADQAKLDKDNLKIKAKNIGLDQAKFDACLGSNKYMPAVNADIEQGRQLSVRSTPTFFVNGQLVTGAVEVEEFSEIIDSLL